MMTKVRIFAVLLFSGFLLVCASAQDKQKSVAAQLKDLRGIFDQSMERIEVDFLDLVDKCRDGYAASLQNAEETATKAGNLEAVVQIRKEKKRFSTDRAVDDQIAPGTHPLIKQAIESYLKSLNKANVIRSQQAANLARKYIDRLEGMKKALTIEKKIDDALTVAAAIKDAKADPTIKSALSAQPEAKSGPTVCPDCKGTGILTRPCPDCNGTGACSYCNGTGIRPGLGGKGVPCFACNGNKKCKRCGGTGKLTQRCSRCRGTGRIK